MRLLATITTIAALVITVTACSPGPGVEVDVLEHEFPDLPTTSDVAVGPGGDVYIVNWAPDAQVRRFTAEGQPIEDWMTQQGGPDLHCPFATDVDSSGQLYVLTSEDDEQNDQVHVLSPTGDFSHTLATLEEGGLDVAVDSAGRVYVPLGSTDGIRVFDADGQHITDWTSPDVPIARPISVAVDASDNVVVTHIRLDGSPDDQEPTITVMTPEGSLVRDWDLEEPPRPQVPADTSVGSEGRVFVVADRGVMAWTYAAEGNLLDEFKPPGSSGQQPWLSATPVPAPDCPAIQVPSRMEPGADNKLYWSPAWDPVTHPPVGLYVLRLPNDQD